MTNCQDDLFGSLFDHRDQRINHLGNPLLELQSHIDWEDFRPLVDRTCIKARQSSAGPKPWDEELMFKALVLAVFTV
jgi:IS5 family transposase